MSWGGEPAAVQTLHTSLGSKHPHPRRLKQHLPQAVEELLQREVDPTGERYSLAKVLHTCQVSLGVQKVHTAHWLAEETAALPCTWPLTARGQCVRALVVPGVQLITSTSTLPTRSLQSDLHAIFLHYCMLDANFARHWPPQLNLQV